jgi:hypothetical protein
MANQKSRGASEIILWALSNLPKNAWHRIAQTTGRNSILMADQALGRNHPGSDHDPPRSTERGEPPNIFAWRYHRDRSYIFNYQQREF